MASNKELECFNIFCEFMKLMILFAVHDMILQILKNRCRCSRVHSLIGTGFGEIQQWMLCSEWVPSEYKSKQLIQ